MSHDKDRNIDPEMAKKFLAEKDGTSTPNTQDGSSSSTQEDLPKLEKIKTSRSKEEVQDIKDLANSTGWKKVPLEILPSKGHYYPDGTEMIIKAAEVAEIRHWSTIDENDAFAMDDHFNFIASKCLRIKMPNKVASYKDLKEEDRFFVIFAIRDLTFKEGENKMFVNLTCKKCEDHPTEKVELRNENFNYYDISEKIMRFYDADEKCFILDNPILGPGAVKIYIPSLGIGDLIKKYIKARAQRGEKTDTSFLKIIPFIIGDWRQFSGKDEDIEMKLKALEQETFGWNKNKISAVVTLIEGLRFGTKLEITKPCTKCQSEMGTPIQFRDGVKSIFVISNILDELL